MLTGAVLDPGGIRLTETDVSSPQVVSTASSHFVLWGQATADGGSSVVLRRLSPDGTLLDPAPRLVLDGIGDVRSGAGERDVILHWREGAGRNLRTLHLDETGVPAARSVEIGPPATVGTVEVTGGDGGFVVTRGWLEEPGFMFRGRFRFVAQRLDTTGAVLDPMPIEFDRIDFGPEGPQGYEGAQTFTRYDGTAYRFTFLTADAGVNLRHRRLESDGGTSVTTTIAPAPTEFLACTRGRCLVSSVPDTSGVGDGGFKRRVIRTTLIGPEGELLASSDVSLQLCPDGSCSEPLAAASSDSFIIALGFSTAGNHDLFFVRLSSDGGVLDLQPRRIGAGLWLRGTISLSCRGHQCALAWQER